MMYDRNGAANNLRLFTSVSLAWWHNYKWATGRIMVVFGNDFIGPMFHHLFPDRHYDTTKMSMSAKATYLQYIRLAYERFKPKLDQALQREDLTTKRRTILQNLSDLCTYFIPVVRMSSLTQHSTRLHIHLHNKKY
jgi:hypothetical protein